MSLRFDITLVFAWLLLLAIGSVMVASASVALTERELYFAAKHGIFVVASICTFAVVFAVPLRVWEWGHRSCLCLAIFLAAAVLVPGIGQVVNGSRRWIDFGFFTIQASEAAKFLVLIYLAGHLTRAGTSMREHLTALVRPLIWISVLLGLLLMEPDFGSVVVLAALTGGLYFLAGVKIRHFMLAASLAATALALLAVLQPYRAERLVSFLDPWSVQFSSGYQLTQALIAFGRGELFGIGLGEGVQKLFYLPEAHNDFIFAVISEELGFIGASLVFGLVMFIVLRAFRIGRAAIEHDRVFAGYVTYGVGLLLGTQLLINVGVNTGVLPTKGLTMPFVSYGGNSLLVCAALLALAVRAHFESAAAPHRRKRP